jgi:hypothetical protein
MALHAFSLQILQKAIRKPIFCPLAPGLLLAFRAAMRTSKFNYVLLRIAVQSCPARAAHADYLG